MQGSGVIPALVLNFGNLCFWSCELFLRKIWGFERERERERERQEA